MVIKCHVSNRYLSKTSNDLKLIENERSTGNMKSERFIKYSPSLEKKLDSRSAALLMSDLEYRFSKKPEGFYKFFKPCRNYLYKDGDSWEETLGMSHDSISRAFSLICKSYPSKRTYLEALDKHHKQGLDIAEDVFDGLPYLRYLDRRRGISYYLRNNDNVIAILSGQKSIKDNIPSYLVRNAKLILCGTQNASYCRTQNASSPIIHREVITENTSLSISLSSKRSKEQPEREKKNKIDFGNTKQPSQHPVSISEIEELVEIWRKITGRDLKRYPTPSAIGKLKEAYVGIFCSSISKWTNYCILFTTCKYLMGETKEKFNLNISWACSIDTIDKMEDKYYTLGDRRSNVIYLDVEPLILTEKDPILLKFKQACLDRLGKAVYVSWISKLHLSHNDDGEIICQAPTNFMASYIGECDRLNLQSFIHKIDVPRVVILYPLGIFSGKKHVIEVFCP